MTGRRSMDAAKNSENVTSVFEQVKAKIRSRWIASTCEEGGCSIALENAPTPFVLTRMHRSIAVDIEAIDLDGPRCDYVYIAGKYREKDVLIAPIELKSGGYKTREVSEQLQAGAEFAERVVPSVCSFVFVPVVAAPTTARRYLFRQLRHGVAFRGVKRPPELIRCGERLRTALEGVRMKGGE